MKLAPLVMLALLLSAPAASALSFLEDFEGFNLGGLFPELKPDQDWYTYTETGDIGTVTGTDPINGAQSFRLTSNEAGSRGTFSLAAPTQLTNVTFTIQGEPGTRQYVQIQSAAPHRTLVEFYVFCDTAGDCEFRVRWQEIDSKGVVLINTTLALDTFTVTVIPSWTTGTFRLFVNGADDGVFPFLQLPSNIGRLRIAQDTSAFPMGAAFDDWFIDGAVPPPAAPEGQDIATYIKQFATDIRFTTPTSLFLFGLFLFIVLVGAVVAAALALGTDNTIVPSLAFYAALVALWLVVMEFWPEWIGITIIILVSAFVSLAIRQVLMGIRDASTDVGIVAGALGYFIIASSLLGFSGYATESIEVPTSSLETPEDVEAQTNTTAPQQSFTGAVAECIITFFSDCSRDTVSTTWATITNVASAIFNFARTAFTFLFQLLTFQLPIPTVFNVIIVLPPAAALATVGFKLITGRGG